MRSLNGAEMLVDAACSGEASLVGLIEPRPPNLVGIGPGPLTVSLGGALPVSAGTSLSRMQSSRGCSY